MLFITAVSNLIATELGFGWARCLGNITNTENKDDDVVYRSYRSKEVASLVFVKMLTR